MNIQSIQKLTLLDFPERVAATVFLGGCNLRCPFCHNSPLVNEIENPGNFTVKEVAGFLKSRRKVLDGVCVTGGEPLLNKDIGELLSAIKETGLAVKIDTNGFYPDMLKKLASDGLIDYVAMDIKNSPEKYPATAGIPNLDIRPVFESVDFLLSGSLPFEFRTTAVKEFHSPGDFEKIGSWLAGAPEYFIQSFTDSGNLVGKAALHALSENEIRACLAAAQKYIPTAKLRGI